MEYREINQDLFEVNSKTKEPYALAHCISADFGMGAGIVVAFNQKWNMKQRLLNGFRIDRAIHLFESKGGYAIPVNVEDYDKNTIVFNLITKRNVWDKPTYSNIESALTDAKDMMNTLAIHKIAMPMIACGIDGKQWDKVSSIIKKVFSDTDMEVLVCIK